MESPDHLNQLTAHLFRENSGKMVAVLSRTFGLTHIDTVMDIVQDTFETALSRWKFSGLPANPAGWLMQVAKNKAINALKREGRMQPYAPSVYLENFDSGAEQQLDILPDADEMKDIQLRLLFACCHPGFSTRNQILITLNVLCGFGVPEIANALLMQEEAVKKTLTRSRQSLAKLGNLLNTHIITRSEERTSTVRTILYLMFNEGYKTTRSKEAIDPDLCFEAIRLARLLPDHSSPSVNETRALLALMFFNLSRFPARLNEQQEWMTLEEQDRNLWNKVFIEEGYRYLKEAAYGTVLTRFHIEAIIASVHCSAESFDRTDWKTIAALYRQLETIESSPHITLNRIIAESYLPGTDPIPELDALHPLLSNHFILPASRGDVYKRKGDSRKAREAYEHAMRLASSPADRRFLSRMILQCQTLSN